MTAPGLFDVPPTPQQLAAAERTRLVDEEAKLFIEWKTGGLTAARRSEIDLRLRAIRERLGHLRRAFPVERPPVAARRRRRTTKALHDGRLAATGERD